MVGQFLSRNFNSLCKTFWNQAWLTPCPIPTPNWIINFHRRMLSANVFVYMSSTRSLCRLFYWVVPPVQPVQWACPQTRCRPRQAVSGIVWPVARLQGTWSLWTSPSAVPPIIPPLHFSLPTCLYLSLVEKAFMSVVSVSASSVSGFRLDAGRYSRTFCTSGSKPMSSIRSASSRMT